MTTFQCQKRFFFGLSIYWLFTGIVVGEEQFRGRGPNAREAISIVVTPYGFAQASLSLTAGTYVFVVLNRSGFEDITVLFERMPDTHITDLPARQEFGDSVGAGRARLIKAAKLTPGRYRIRVANRPNWVSTIDVN